jgi:hypothetical protein
LYEAQIAYQPAESTMAVPNEDSSETNLPYSLKDNSSLMRAAFRGFHLRPGDWLVPLIGLALIIVSALVLL